MISLSQRLWICLLLTTCVATAAEVSHHVVYSRSGDFAGWPANEGLWAWGNEILTGFEVSQFVETEGDHSINRLAPKRIAFARSADGGETWVTEEHPEVAPPEYLGDAEKFKQVAAHVAAPQTYAGGFDFSDPNFILKLRGPHFYVSTDRGRAWRGPYLLPELDYIGEARTSYIATGRDSCLIFMTGRVARDGFKYGRSCVLQTTDGGKSFQFLSWVGEDITAGLDLAGRKEGSIFSIMPSAVQLGEGHFLCAVRQRIDKAKWSDLFETKDGGRTWKKLGVIEKGSTNPVTLLRLQDGRIAAVYCTRRKKPFGLAAKLSADDGRTWSKEIVLRSDARKWDIGYTRAMQRPDGKVVAVYYYTTDKIPHNFIAATVWTPPAK